MKLGNQNENSIFSGLFLSVKGLLTDLQSFYFKSLVKRISIDEVIRQKPPEIPMFVIVQNRVVFGGYLHD